MTDKIVYIRTDANRIIATGHMMRCLSIANSISKNGNNVVFLLSSEESTALLKNHDYDYHILNSDYNKLDTTKEINYLIELFSDDRKKGFDPILFIDSYGITENYCKRLKPYVKIAAIDNLFTGIYDANLLIGCTIYYSVFDYRKSYKNKPTKLLLGTEYVPLRPQFLNVNKKRPFRTIDSNHMKLLVMSGGGDKLNFLFKFIQYGIQHSLLSDDEYHIVVGAYNEHIDELKKIGSNHSNIVLHTNVSNMASLMSSSDVIVSAAGTVLYECCSVGVPTVFYLLSEDQRYDSYFFIKKTGMIYAGNAQSSPDKTIQSIYSGIAYLKTSKQSRKEMIKKMERLVDGRGADRIASEIGRL